MQNSLIWPTNNSDTETYTALVNGLLMNASHFMIPSEISIVKTLPIHTEVLQPRIRGLGLQL